MIELINIKKHFGHVKALQGVSLQSAAGTIFGIIGENGAGKSTLMKILTGFYSRSAGEILIDGVEQSLSSPRDARKIGIGMLYQEPLDFPQLSVLDNFLAGYKDYNPRRAEDNLMRLCDEFGFDLPPAKPVESLTVGERQQLELLRIIRDGVRILILDEPTTGISASQQQQLFDALRKLRSQDAVIFLVSHKLEEIEQLCDAVAVLRDGRLVATQQKPFDRSSLLTAMFGQVPEKLSSHPHTRLSNEPVVVFENVTINSGRSGLHNASVKIEQGEVVALAGVDGSGQSVFLKACYGLLPPVKGTISRFREQVTGEHKEKTGKAVFLPADRLSEGLFATLSIREHQILASDGPPFISSRSQLDKTHEAIKRFNIRGTINTSAADLSGGNQQRLMLSLIPEHTRLILMENPTRGLDIHSAAWTWDLFHQRVDKGATIVFASPDLEEIMREATRIIVFFNGSIIFDKPTSETDFQSISRAITGDKTY